MNLRLRKRVLNLGDSFIFNFDNNGGTRCVTFSAAEVPLLPFFELYDAVVDLIKNTGTFWVSARERSEFCILGHNLAYMGRRLSKSQSIGSETSAKRSGLLVQ